MEANGVVLVVVQPVHFGVAGAAGAGALFQYCGPGPARAMAPKEPRARVAARRARVRADVSVFMGGMFLFFGDGSE